MTKEKVWDIILVLFSIYWTTFFLLDYLDKHPNHVLAFRYFRYTNLCLFLVALGGGLSYLVTKIRTGFISKMYNGVALYFIGILIITAITISYNKYINLDIGISNYLHMYSRLSINFFTGFFIILACFSIGNLILKRYMYPDVIVHQHFTIDFGLGAMIITMLLFIIGAIGQLRMIVVLPIFLLLIAINWRGSFDFIMNAFLRPFKIRQENGFWGYFCLFILFAFLILNLLAIDLPFPVGFDSRNLYMNIANQIGQSGSLVEGYQPYSWSLFMSLGIVLFDRIETSLFLSFITGVLCLFSAFHLGRKHFKLSFNYSSFGVLLFCTIPAFANQLFVEHKTDFGLVFFQLITLCVFMEWHRKDFASSDQDTDTNKKELLIFLMMGLFIGFGLSIKALNIFFVFALTIVMWARKGHTIGLLSLTIISFAFMLLFNLNSLSGLDKYHVGNNSMRWVYLGLGTILFGYYCIKNRQTSVHFIKRISLIAIVAILPMTPWVIKNYTETKSLSPSRIMLGSNPNPNINFRHIEKQMEE